MKSLIYLICFLLTITSINAQPKSTEDIMLEEVGLLLQNKMTAEAFEHLDKILETEPLHNDAIATRIFLNIKIRNNIKQVLADCETAATKLDQGVTIYIEVGQLYMDNNKPDEAIIIADKGLSLYPRSFKLEAIKGEAFLDKKYYSQAINHLEKALNIQEHIQTRNILAKAKYANKDKEGALLEIDKMLKFTPNFDKAFDTRSDFHAIEKDYAKALSDNENAIRYAGNQKMKAYYASKRAFLLKDNHDDEGACKWAMRAKEYGDQSAYVLLDLDCEQ